ncbi:MAG TPA: sugar ABC transporter permease [Acetobacteraceae bacterium]|nr:sugar ABC transporter permease [Acetobacteraceae bacterium]
MPAPRVIRRREGWLLIAPLAAFLVLWLGFPFLTDVVYSVSQVGFTTLRQPRLSGFGHYAAVLRDAAFWHAMGFSFRYAAVETVVQVAAGLALAVALAPILSRHRFLLAFILLPLMIAPALNGLMYRLMLNDFVGIIPAYLGMLSLSPDLLSTGWVFVTVAAIDAVQNTPFTVLLVLAALQAIPGELRDAARVDGASAWQEFRRVVLPLLLPVLGIAGLVRFIDSFRVFDHIYVLTGGGPGNETTGISIYIYKAFFQQQQLGLAVAASMILLLLSLAALSLLMHRSLRGAVA